jgi:hypothetical protein
VPVNVIPFTEPVPDTEVTDPTLTEPPRLIGLPLIAIELFANWAFEMVPLRSVVGIVAEPVIALVPLPFKYPVRVTAPVPPLATPNVPARVTAPVVAVVGVRPYKDVWKDCTPKTGTLSQLVSKSVLLTL